MNHISEENIDLFERFLIGELNSDELTSFESRLAYDSDFNKQFDDYKGLEAGIKNHFRDEFKNKLKNVDYEYEVSQLNRKKQRATLIVISVSVAAALVIGLLLTPFFFDSSERKEIVEKYWQYDEGLPVRMSNEGNYDKAMNEFKQENWRASIKFLKPIESDTAYFYQGLSLYKVSEYEKAISYLEKIDASSIYSDNAELRIALIHFITDKNKGIKLLKKIATSDSSESKIAANIIKEISSD